MNEQYAIRPEHAVASRIDARLEGLERGALWVTGVAHLGLLAVFFLIVRIATELAGSAWPWLAVRDGPLLDAARLVLLIGAGWILVDGIRRNARLRRLEIALLRSEIEDIRSATSHN